jgi:hypothetical protein
LGRGDSRDFGLTDLDSSFVDQIGRHGAPQAVTAAAPISDGVARAEVRYGFMERPEHFGGAGGGGAKRLARPLIAMKPSLVDASRQVPAVRRATPITHD